MSLSFSPSSKEVLLASCGGDHAVKVWEAKKGTSLTLKWTANDVSRGSHSSVVTSVAWGKKTSAHLLYSGGWDGSVKAWESKYTEYPIPVATLTVSGVSTRVCRGVWTTCAPLSSGGDNSWSCMVFVYVVLARV